MLNKSTVLGANPIGEFDAEGDWVSSTIYADGMKVAVYKPKISSEYSDIMLWQHTDPVTGSPASSGRVADTSGFAHLDPFGNDVTTGPPDPLEPPYVEPTQPFFWPLEIEGSPTNEAALGMAAYANRVNAEYDRSRAEYFWAIGRRDLAMEIVANNPNVGILYNISGFGLTEPRSGTIFGSQAAGFLFALDSAIRSGSLVGAGQSGSTQKNCTPPSSADLVSQNHAVLGLFPGEFDADFESFYNGIGERNQMVLLNTVDALVDAGVDLTNARFENFYYSDKPGHLSFGLRLTGLDRNRLGNLEGFRGGYRSSGSVARGSLEITLSGRSVFVDIDLYNPNAGAGPAFLHGIEVLKNSLRNKPTNPNSVTKALDKRGVSTAVNCPR